MFRRTCADDASASASSRAASASAASRYWGMTNGVRGAFAFVSGFVASQAAKAGLNSARKRRS